MAFRLALSLLVEAGCGAIPGVNWAVFIDCSTGGIGHVNSAVFVPNPISQAPKGDTVATPTKLKRMLLDPQLFRLDAGIFILHLVLTAVFVALPLDLVDAGLVKEKHWMLYFPAFVGAFFLMVPLIIIGVKRNNTKTMFQLSLVIMMLSLATMGIFADNIWMLSAAVVLFFTGFNYLEASLPSLIAKFCPVGDKGSAMGVYSTSQFLGAFCGGMLGGGAYQLVGASGVFFVALALMFVWLLLTFGMQKPVLLKSYTLEANIKDKNDAQVMATELSQLAGVVEAIVVLEEKAAYLKADDKFNLSEARAVLGSVQ
ncbi:MFS transporter [Paucibacter sp. O1-1]|nr:MFS transporter [Paucibacter sp. O1-1]MDA3830810.1 MFS transporter [Paucibacter sp. O1-1]